MKKNNRNTKIGIAAFFSISLLIMGCYEFDFVIQPYNVNLNSSFNVQISATTTDGDSTQYYWSYFTVKLPVGWTVVDSIPYINPIQNGLYIYSDSLTQEMTNQNPPPDNYAWHVFKSSEQILYFAGDNFQFEPIIVTDDQYGFFSIDYHLGDSESGFIGEYTTSSLDHLISVGMPDLVIVTNAENEGPGSLRGAIDSVAYGGTINFDLGNNNIIELNSPLNIDKSLSIEANIENPISISGNNDCQVIRIINNTQVHIENINVMDGLAEYGGGIRCDNSELSLKNVEINNNVADYGGGIYTDSNCEIDFENVVVDGNHSTIHGGGWYCNGSAQVTNTTFSNNTGNVNGGGVCIVSQRNILISNSLIENNTASNGAGIYLNSDNILIVESDIKQNIAGISGGGIYLQQSNPFIKSTVIEGNNAYNGGGIFGVYSSPQLVNLLLISNDADYSGGGMDFQNASFPKVINSTLYNNRCFTIGAGGIILTNSNLEVTNSILWQNWPCEIANVPSFSPNVITISYSNIFNGEEFIIINGNTTLNWLEGNINEDPVFVDVGDFPFQINDYSPCIDGGTPDTTGLSLPEYDLADNTRIVNNRIDIGAYEWNIMVDVEEQVITEPSKPNINIYPNPVKDHATISYNTNKSELVKIQLYNTSGICVKSIDINNPKSGEQSLTINTNNISPGIYFLHLQTGQKVITKKIIKVN